jgi:hypothetical protein
MLQGGEKRRKCLQKIFRFRFHQVIGFRNFRLELDAIGDHGKRMQFKGFGRVQEMSGGIGRKRGKE